MAHAPASTHWDSLVGSGVVALHDHQLAGSTTTVDHLAIGSSGVWVIGAQHVPGHVQKRDVGTFSRSWRLYVGRRDCTQLLTGMARQVRDVRVTLGEDAHRVPVVPVLCFVDAEWGWLSRPFQLNGVVVAPPSSVTQLVSQPGPWSSGDVERMARSLGADLAIS